MRDEVVIKPKGPTSWELVWPLEYHGKYDKWTVPSGFVTDFASVPQILWSILPPYGKHTKAAIVHDWLYLKRPAVRVRDRRGRFIAGGWVRISRSDADGVFLRIMRECGSSWWRRTVMYLGVRLGGWYMWNKYRANGPQL